jgi:hypothetical protein
MASYTLNTTVAQETIVTRAREASNNAATDAISAPRGSTQAQCDALIAAAAAEDPPRVIGPVTVYANNGPYLLAVLTGEMKRILEIQRREDKATYEAALAVATQTQKDEIAAILGLAPGTLKTDKA